MPTDEDYTISELAALGGTTTRTVRYYVSVGLLPSPGQSGPATRYGEAHLRRLRLIRRLQADHLPLAEIRDRLDGLDDDDVERSLVTPSTVASGGSALDYIRSVKSTAAPAPIVLSSISLPRPSTGPTPTAGTDRSQWERVAVAPDVEIHIRRPLSRRDQKQVERLIKIAREMLEEDQP